MISEVTLLMKNIIKRLLENKTSRYILTATSYLLLTAAFFGAGYAIGTSNGGGLVSAPVYVAAPAEDNSPSPAAIPSTPLPDGYRLILEDGELRLYMDKGGFSRLISNEPFTEQLYPKEDTESLKNGLHFERLEDALTMLENFLS